MTNGNGDRRDFLKAAGAAMAAVALPAAVFAQGKGEASDDARAQSPEQLLMIGHGGNSNLSGTYGRGHYKIFLNAQIGVGGFGSISDDVYPEINTHFKITSAARVPKSGGGHAYAFTGLTTDARDSGISGRITSIAVDPTDSNGSCWAVLDIEGTPIQDLRFWVQNLSGNYGPLV